MSKKPGAKPPNTKCAPQDPQYVTNDTASDDPTLMKARIFAGCLSKEKCTRENIIEVFSMYGPLRGVSHFLPAGFAYIQFENVDDAQSAVANLNDFVLNGRKMVVKIADPTMQKPLKQGGQGTPNPKFQQKQANNSKSFPNKQNQKGPAGQQSFGAFGKNPNAQSKFQKGAQKFGQKGQQQFQKDKSQFATASNAIPLGGGSQRGKPGSGANTTGRGGFKNKKPMPNQQSKKPRFSNEHQKGSQQYNYNQSEYGKQDASYYDQYSNYDEQTGAYNQQYADYNPESTDASAEPGYQGFENPYGEIAYGTEEGEYVEGQYPEGAYAEGEYVEGEYTEEQLAEYYAQYGYEYTPGEVYYDEFGQPVEYAAPAEGFENQDYANTDYYAQQPAEQQYDDNYLSQLPRHSSPKNAPNLGPPSKPRKAEFVNQQNPVVKLAKQPQAAQELEDRPIHYNYEIPDFFVCGGCHFSTANPQYFIQHRAKPCKVKQVTKGENEPDILQCQMCPEILKNSWDLVAHMGRKHCLYLFNETHLAGGAD